MKKHLCRQHLTREKVKNRPDDSCVLCCFDVVIFRVKSGAKTRDEITGVNIKREEMEFVLAKIKRQRKKREDVLQVRSSVDGSRVEAQSEPKEGRYNVLSFFCDIHCKEFEGR